METEKCKNSIKEEVTINLKAFGKSNPHFYTIMICLGQKRLGKLFPTLPGDALSSCFELIQAKIEKFL